MPIAKERFFVGHNVMLGHVPEKVSTEMLQKAIGTPKHDIAKFGLFDTATPNFNNFYPDLTEDDLKPKESDYVQPIARALSNIIINRYGPIEFPAAALKASASKLIGQTVYPNHEDSVGNELGVVIDAYWQKSYTMDDGTKIPAGINVRLKIDGKSNPKIARGVMSSPPSIHSMSVSVIFDWVKSHTDMSDEDFWAKQGTYDSTGTLVRRVVREIISYEEISFVKHGQDPYAQILDGKGKIVNPGHADTHNRIQNKFSAEDFAKHGSSFDFQNLKRDRVKLSQSGTIPNGHINNNNSTQKHVTMNEELLKFLRLQLGLAADATEEAVLAKLKEQLPLFTSLQAKLTKAETDFETANTNLTALTAKYPEGTIALSKEDSERFEALKKESETRLSDLRKETLKLYHLSVGGADKAQTGLTELIAQANLDACTALYNQFNAQVDKEHKLSCQACGSTNILRATSKGAKLGVQSPDGSEEVEPGASATEVKSDLEVIAALTKIPANTSKLYNQKK